MDDRRHAAAGAPARGGPAYTDLWSRPGFLARRLHQLHAALFLEECGGHDVTPVQYAVLSVLYPGAELDQVSIAGETGIDRNNAADVIRRLERRGHVERVANPSDRRRRLTRITPQGRRFVEDVHGAMERAQRRLVRGLSGDEAGLLMELMRRAVDGAGHAGRAPLRASGPGRARRGGPGPPTPPPARRRSP